MDKLKNKIRDIANFILGIIFCTCVSVLAETCTTTINSSDVTYGENSTAQAEVTNLISTAGNMNLRLTNLENAVSNTAGFHNSIFRGKNITSYYDDESLFSRISSGEFEDLYVGDYIVKNNITWRIAGFDLYLNKGYPALTTHHAVILPDKSLRGANMNSTDTTVGGYAGSEMFQTTLPNVFSNYISPVFGEHVLEFYNMPTTGIDSSLINRFGTATGASNSFRFYSRNLDLMNENQLYGSIVFSSSGYDTGTDSVQFPLFRLAPQYVISNTWIWLKNVVDVNKFGLVDRDGTATYANASWTGGGVRPYFYID